MAAIENLITENMDVWTSAIKQRATQGRGSSKKQELYGIQKLRELILELAVRGLLVPQDPNDEPASVLLEKIAAARESLIQAGKLKKQKLLPNVDIDEQPFILPRNWLWARLGNITNYGTSDKIDAKNANERTWVLELEDVEKETSKLLQKVRFSERQFKSSKNVFYKNDVIYGKLRPYLDKVIVADEDGVCTTEMVPVRAHACITPEFLRLTMKSPYFKTYANNSTHGMNLPRLGTDKARLALIPILSTNEQKRIVAKVDELMALCDQLEERQENNIAAQQQLVEVLLAALTQATDAEAFQQAWTRLAANFDTLFTTENSIEQLKQTLLQLAVMGKLVPQDPNDEPASVLVEKIASEKKRLIAEKVIKNSKPLTSIDDSEKAFSLPENWKWERLGNTGIGATGKTPNTKLSEYFDGSIPFIGPGEITPSGNLLDSDRLLTDEGIKHSTEAVVGDILMVCIGGSIGKSVIADKNLAFNQQINRLRPLFIIPEYLNAAMSSNVFYRMLINKATGSATPIINRTKWEELLVPVPPLLEQKRIVEKVDQLFAICDQLKEKIRTAEETQLQLADALTNQAIQ